MPSPAPYRPFTPRKMTMPGMPAPPSSSRVEDKNPVELSQEELLIALHEAQQKSLESDKKLLQSERDKRELERQARVAAETASPSSHFPYPETKSAPNRKQSPVPVSVAPDEAIGKTVRYVVKHLGVKVLALVLSGAGLGAGALAFLKPSADPAKQDATLANTQALRAEMTLMRTQLTGVIVDRPSWIEYTKCLEEGIEEIGSQVLPAHDRVGSASPMRVWIAKRCVRLRPPP
jgi:hypothetical protein